MAWLLQAMRPLIRNASLLYHERALREIDPLHPDVPEIVRTISRLKAERSSV
jgi:hypothetical protein